MGGAASAVTGANVELLTVPLQKGTNYKITVGNTEYTAQLDIEEFSKGNPNGTETQLPSLYVLKSELTIPGWKIHGTRSQLILGSSNEAASIKLNELGAVKVSAGGRRRSNRKHKRNRKTKKRRSNRKQ